MKKKLRKIFILNIPISKDTNSNKDERFIEIYIFEDILIESEHLLVLGVMLP